MMPLTCCLSRSELDLDLELDFHSMDTYQTDTSVSNFLEKCDKKQMTISSRTQGDSRIKDRLC